MDEGKLIEDVWVRSPPAIRCRVILFLLDGPPVPPIKVVANKELGFWAPSGGRGVGIFDGRR